MSSSREQASRNVPRPDPLSPVIRLGSVTEKGDACFQAMLRLHHSKVGGASCPSGEVSARNHIPASDTASADVDSGDLVWGAHACAVIIFSKPAGKKAAVIRQQRANRRKVYRLAQKYRETGKGIPFVALESMNTICLSRAAYQQYVANKTARAR